MDCAQALAIAAAAFVLAGEPIERPLAGIRHSLLNALEAGETFAGDAACAVQVNWNGAFARSRDGEAAYTPHTADRRAMPNIPDARIHAVFRRPI